MPISQKQQKPSWSLQRQTAAKIFLLQPDILSISGIWKRDSSEQSPSSVLSKVGLNYVRVVKKADAFSVERCFHLKNSSAIPMLGITMSNISSFNPFAASLEQSNSLMAPFLSSKANFELSLDPCSSWFGRLLLQLLVSVYKTAMRSVLHNRVWKEFSVQSG